MSAIAKAAAEAYEYANASGIADMRSSDVGLASLVSESAPSAASCLDVSRSCAPLSSAPASPACLSPEAYIAMPSLSQAGMRPPLRLTSAAWASSCATVIRRWSVLLFP